MSTGRLLDSAIFDEVAAVIGSGDARRLCDRFGGTSLYVPKHAANNHEITLVIGDAQAKLLCFHFGGNLLQLPKAYHRRERVLELYDRGDMTLKAIALATDYHWRHVKRIIAEHRESASHDDDQPSLFPDL